MATMDRHRTHTIGWRRSCVFLIISTTSVCIFNGAQGFSVAHEENRLSHEGHEDDTASPEVTYVLHQMLQVMQERDQHTALYERVAVLEGKIRENSEDEIRFKNEFEELKAKVPVLEERIANLTIMKQKSDVFEIKMEKLIHKYEEKLSTLASEIIRLKKNEARFKDLQALRDQAGNSVLLRRENLGLVNIYSGATTVEECPSVGVDLDAVRVGEECLYMAWRSSLNWSDAHDHCQALGGDLAAPDDLLPLKTFLHRTFARGPSLWLGASYDEVISSSSSPQRYPPPYQQHQRPDPRTAALMLHELKEEDQEVRDQGGGDHTAQALHASHSMEEHHILGHDIVHLPNLPSTPRNEEIQADERRPINISLQEKMETGYGNVNIESYRNLIQSSSRALQGLHTEQLSDSISPMLIQRIPNPEGEGGAPSKVRCLLLWLNRELEYELVGRPCNEEHYFVCQINKERKQEIPFEMDSLLQE